MSAEELLEEAGRRLGASLGVDVQPVPGSARVLWRTELRGYSGKDPIFPDHGATNGLGKQSRFAVTSQFVLR